MKLKMSSRVIYLLPLLLIFSLQLQAQEKPVFELTGKVLLPDGSPAAGATVEVTWPKNDIKTVSDEFGQFKMKLKPGSYGITAKNDPFVLPVPHKFFEIDSKGSIDKPFILQLETGANLTGRVIDKATREPVPGTKLTLEEIGDTTSAEDGSFIFSCIPKNNHLLTAYKAGYAQPVIQFNTINKGQIDLLIELKPEVILRGQVTDEKGNPISNARVRQENRQINLHSTRTDKEGHYELRGLEPESHLSFEVYADHFKPIYEKEIAIGSSDRELTVNFQMIPEVEGRRSIYGHVFKADGSMAQGVKVGCDFSKTSVNYPSTTTDEKGYYLLQEIDAKKSLITVEGKGYAPDCKYAEADKNLEIDFVLEPGHYLEGKVVDEEGNPLQGALLSPSIVSTPEMIKYWGAPGLQMSLDIFDKTDLNGHFRLDDLPSKKVTMNVSLSGYACITEIPFEVDKKDVIITLHRVGHISGTVLDGSTRKPITQFTIATQYETHKTQFNSPDGAFTCQDWSTEQSNKVDFVLEAEGYLPVKVQGADVQPASIQDYKALTIRMWPSKPFKGCVIDASTGKPVDQATITLLDPGTRDTSIELRRLGDYFRPAIAKTDSKGNFVVQKIPCRAGIVLVEKSGYGRVFLRDIDFYHPLKISLPKAATIQGKSPDDPEHPYSETTVNVIVPYKGNYIEYDRVSVDSSGQFTITDLPPGEYQIQLDDDYEGWKVKTVQVQAGQTIQIDWAKPDKAILEGVITKHGQPVVGANLIVYPENNGMYITFDKTDTNGRYKLSLPKVGHLRLSVSKGQYNFPDYQTKMVSISIKPGLNHLDLQMPGGSISGKVVYQKDGSPAAGVTVYATHYLHESDKFGNSWYGMHIEPILFFENKVETDKNGDFIIDNLDTDQWLIMADRRVEDGQSIPGPIIKLAPDKIRQNVMIKIPEMGSAELLVIDPKNNQSTTQVIVDCIDERRVFFYPQRYPSNAISVDLYNYQLSPEGALIVNDLPPGKYQACASSERYPTAWVPFEIKAGQVTHVTIPLQTGAQIAFRLQETARNPIPGEFVIGYKIADSKTGKPVLQDCGGLNWGGMMELSGNEPRKAILPIQAGDYTIEAVLQRNDGRHMIDPDSNLWSSKFKVKTITGKVTVIDIPWTGSK